MNEQERADWLARALDDLIRGNNTGGPPSGLQPDELNALLRVAKVRLAQARSSAQTGLQYEGEVWQQVIARIDAGAPQENRAAHHIANVGETAAERDPAAELDGLQDIVSLRREMSEQLSALADTHRDEVWKQVQSRIRARAAKKGGLFSFLARPRAQADALVPATGDAALDEPAYRTGDDYVDSLLSVARARRSLSRMAQQASEESQGKLWARLRAGATPPAAEARQARTRRQLGWGQLAMAGAGLALMVAAVGPLPSTGFAEHPGVRLVNYIAHLGVTETDQAPPAPPAGDVVQGIDTDAARAAAIMGIPVVEPAYVPEGFSAASSKFFSSPLTADKPGVYASGYTAGEARLMVYQEAASGPNLVVGGAAADIVLPGNVPATYFEGAWETADGGFAWSDAGSQTLVFEHMGVRAIIQASGGTLGQAQLAAVAEGIITARSGVQ